MQEELTLQDLPLGQMGEIISFSEELQNTIYQEFGASVGMTIMILHKAVDWLVQIGYSQMDMNRHYLEHIKVKPIAL